MMFGDDVTLLLAAARDWYAAHLPGRAEEAQRGPSAARARRAMLAFTDGGSEPTLCDCAIAYGAALRGYEILLDAGDTAAAGARTENVHAARLRLLEAAGYPVADITAEDLGPVLQEARPTLPPPTVREGLLAALGEPLFDTVAERPGAAPLARAGVTGHEVLNWLHPDSAPLRTASGAGACVFARDTVDPDVPPNGETLTVRGEADALSDLCAAHHLLHATYPVRLVREGRALEQGAPQRKERDRRDEPTARHDLRKVLRDISRACDRVRAPVGAEEFSLGTSWDAVSGWMHGRVVFDGDAPEVAAHHTRELRRRLAGARTLQRVVTELLDALHTPPTSRAVSQHVLDTLVHVAGPAVRQVAAGLSAAPALLRGALREACQLDRLVERNAEHGTSPQRDVQLTRDCRGMQFLHYSQYLAKQDDVPWQLGGEDPDLHAWRVLPDGITERFEVDREELQRTAAQLPLEPVVAPVRAAATYAFAELVRALCADAAPRLDLPSGKPDITAPAAADLEP